MLVLIADEDISARDAARRSVERFGYRCAVASDGAEAWNRIVSENPDVILASLGLPTVSGLDLYRRVRESQQSSARYLVAIVGDGDSDGLFAAMAGGADDVLTRADQPEQLHARLQVAERFLLVYRQFTDCQAELKRAQRALHQSARTDTLTQLRNRLQLNDDLDLFQGQLQRYGHRYATAIVDLDRFGSYNTSNSHLAGDEALRIVAQTVARQLRTGDRAYRYSGDELVILLPEQSTSSARIAAERIREAVDGLGLPHPGNPPWNIVTVSVGVAAFSDDMPATYDALLARAEAALRQAKSDGGNRVAFEG
jgi:two-component system, chemotaxis family, response regulator WspR